MHSPSTFILGTAMFVTGSLLTFVAFGFAAQSLLASLEGVQFVSNVVFAKVIRGVPITPQVALGVAMIVGGVATVVLSGSHESELFTSQELFELYLDNHAYQAFLVIAGGAAVVLRYTERAYSKRLTIPGRTPWPFSATVIPFTYAAFSALFGTQSVVQAKCLMMCLSLTLNRGENQFTHPFTYAMLGAWLVTVYIWLSRMGKALKRFDPMFIIPVLQVLFILLAIVSGGIYFEEFETLSPDQWGGFVGGVLLVCGGLYFLAPKKTDLPSAAAPLSEGESEGSASPLLLPQPLSGGEEPGNVDWAASGVHREKDVLVLGRGDDDDEVGGGGGQLGDEEAGKGKTTPRHQHFRPVEVESASPPPSSSGRSDLQPSSPHNGQQPPEPAPTLWADHTAVPQPHHLLSPPLPPPPALAPSPESPLPHCLGMPTLEQPEGSGACGGDGGSGYPQLLASGMGHLGQRTLHAVEQAAGGVAGGVTHTATEIVGILEAVGAVVVEDLNTVTSTTTDAASTAVQGATTVVLNPNAAVTSGLSTVGGAVGTAGGWLVTTEDGQVDWLATTSQLNLLAAGASQQIHAQGGAGGGAYGSGGCGGRRRLVRGEAGGGGGSPEDGSGGDGRSTRRKRPKKKRLEDTNASGLGEALLGDSNSN